MTTKVPRKYAMWRSLRDRHPFFFIFSSFCPNMQIASYLAIYQRIYFILILQSLFGKILLRDNYKLIVNKWFIIVNQIVN
jgi:hypothetical protein